MIPYLIGQERFCRVLREHLKKYDVEVEYSSELVALEQFANHVNAKVKKGESVEVFDIPYVVGADGGKGETYPYSNDQESFLTTVILYLHRCCT